MIPDRLSQRAWEPWAACAAVVVVTIPIVITILALNGRTWLPAGDEAAMLLRIRDVGTSHTPTIGVYSQRGWAHPGPALFYLLAVPFRLFGGDPIDMFRAAGVLNVASVALIGLLAWRRRGLMGTLLAMAFTALVVRAMGPTVLVGAWNPYVPLLAYVAFLFATWSILEQDWMPLPLVAFLGSAIVQMHIGYTPLVVVAVVLLAVAWRARVRGPEPPARPPSPRLLGFTGALVALMWLPSLLDQIFTGGNLRNLGGYFTGGNSDPIGLGDGLGLLSAHTRPTGPLTGGDLRRSFASLQGESLGWLLLLVLLLAVAIGVARRRSPALTSLPMLALAQLVAGGLAASRVEQPVLGYLVIWMLPLVAFCWFAITSTAVEFVAERLGRPEVESSAAAPTGTAGGEVRPAHAPVVLALVAVLGLALVLRSGQGAADPVLPRQRHAAAVTSVSGQLLDRLDRDPSRSRQVVGVGDDFNEAWVGVLYQLDVNGFAFTTPDGAKGLKWGPDHADKGGDVAQTVTIATQLPSGFDDAVSACEGDDRQQELARWDQLNHGDRARLQALQLANLQADGDLPPKLRAELQDLSARSFRMVAFKGPRPCGRT